MADVFKYFDDLHKMPEIGMHEFKTSAYIADHLKKMGYEVQEHIGGGTGVVAIYDSGKPGPVLNGVDTGILDPRDTYADASQWEEKAKDLAGRFIKNFKKYEGNEHGKALVSAGPQL